MSLFAPKRWSYVTDRLDRADEAAERLSRNRAHGVSAARLPFDAIGTYLGFDIDAGTVVLVVDERVETVPLAGATVTITEPDEKTAIVNVSDRLTFTVHGKEVRQARHWATSLRQAAKLPPTASAMATTTQLDGGPLTGTSDLSYRGVDGGLFTALRGLALMLACVFVVLDGLFIASYAVSDPGGWKGRGLVALAVLVLAGLAVLAWVRPAPAAFVLSVLTATAVAISLLFDQQIGLFVLILPLALLGWRRPRLAGWNLLAAGMAAGYQGSASSSAIAVPVFVIGLLYLISSTEMLKQASNDTGALGWLASRDRRAADMQQPGSAKGRKPHGQSVPGAQSEKPVFRSQCSRVPRGVPASGASPYGVPPDAGVLQQPCSRRARCIVAPWRWISLRKGWRSRM